MQAHPFFVIGLVDPEEECEFPCPLFNYHISNGINFSAGPIPSGVKFG